jgi:hypothetical protein
VLKLEEFLNSEKLQLRYELIAKNGFLMDNKDLKNDNQTIEKSTSLIIRASQIFNKDIKSKLIKFINKHKYN